jgi:hypothetical protein
MALPKIVTPTYELEIPSSKKKITYRPFIVKEEKILLLAQEAGEESDILNAIKQIIKNCTFEEVEVNDMALFDLEYIFLRIRSKSIGEKVELKLLCDDDGETYADVTIDLEKIEVDFPKEHTNNIQLTDTISLVMRYPQMSALNLMTDSDTETIFHMIKTSIRQIIDGETIYEQVDFTEEDLDEFIESLSSEHFKQIQEFFQTMPKLKHVVKYKNPKTKKQNKRTLEGLNSFFV